MANDVNFLLMGHGDQRELERVKSVLESDLRPNDYFAGDLVDVGLPPELRDEREFRGLWAKPGWLDPETGQWHHADTPVRIGHDGVLTLWACTRSMPPTAFLSRLSAAHPSVRFEMHACVEDLISESWRAQAGELRHLRSAWVDWDVNLGPLRDTLRDALNAYPLDFSPLEPDDDELREEQTGGGE